MWDCPSLPVKQAGGTHATNPTIKYSVCTCINGTATLHEDVETGKSNLSMGANQHIVQRTKGRSHIPPPQQKEAVD